MQTSNCCEKCAKVTSHLSAIECAKCKCHAAPEANEKTCEMCNGTGYITRDDYDTRTGEHVQVESRCPCNPKILQDEYTDD